MRFLWKSGACLALVLAALLVASVPAAGYHTGTITPASLTVNENVSLPINNYTGYTFSLGLADSIAYSIQSGGDNIDVFFFNATGLAAYRAEPPSSSQAILALTNRIQFVGTFDLAIGSITVVIDNVDFSGAMPSGTAFVQVAMSKSGGSPNTDFLGGLLLLGLVICGAIIAVIVIVIVAIVLLVTRRQAPPMPPPPPYPPPQQPWPPQQPPQGGWPPGPGP